MRQVLDQHLDGFFDNQIQRLADCGQTRPDKLRLRQVAVTNTESCPGTL
jgi:hypothetical protein